jgi:hypothetical protein
LTAFECCSRLLNAGEGDIAESLEAAIFRLGGETNTGDGAKGLELLGDSVGIDVEGQIADEEGIGRLRWSVTECLATLLLALIIGGALVGKVNIEGAAIKFSTLASIMSLGAVGTRLEVDVAVARAY